MRGLLRLSGLIDAFNERVGRAAAWAILAAILVSAVNAMVRKGFSVSSNAWLELQWYLFGAVFMLSAAWTLKANEHIRVDVVSARLSKRTRDWIDVFGHVLFLFPFAAVMTWLSAPFFWRSFASGEVSSSAGGLPIWPAKGLILLGSAMLLVQCASELIKRLAVLGRVIEDPAGPGHPSAAEAEAARLIAAVPAKNRPGDPASVER